MQTNKRIKKLVKKNMADLEFEADRISRAYVRLCSGACYEDLVQECWAAFMVAARSYAPRVGVKFKWYARQAAMRQCGLALRRSLSPVHVAKNNTAAFKKIGSAAPVDVVEHKTFTDGETQASRARWRLAVRQLVARISADVPNSDLAKQVILDDKDPRIIAVVAGKSVSEIRRSCRLVRRRVSESYELWMLAKEAP